MKPFNVQEHEFVFREEEFSGIAGNCSAFLADDEEEWVVETGRNCLNCRRRRWIPGGFQCMKENAPCTMND